MGEDGGGRTPDDTVDVHGDDPSRSRSGVAILQWAHWKSLTGQESGCTDSVGGVERKTWGTGR